MKYVKDDIVTCKNDIDYVITKVDKRKGNYRAVPLMQLQWGFNNPLSCKLEEEHIVKLSGRNTKYGIIMGGIKEEN